MDEQPQTNPTQPVGEQPQAPPTQDPHTMQNTNLWAILGLIFAFLFPILGIVFSIIGLNQIKKNPNQKGKGLAIAGLIIGGVSTIITIIAIIFIFSLGAMGAVSPSKFIQDTCIFSGNFKCDGFGPTSSGFSFTLRNNIEEVTITSVSATYVDTDTDVTCLPNSLTMSTGATQTFNCVANHERGKAYKYIVDIDYYRTASGPTFSRTAGGDIVLRA